MQHKANDWVLSKINLLVGPQEPLLATVRRRTFTWFGHVSRHDSLSKPSFRATWRVGDAVEMPDKQHQKADIPAHARTTDDSLPQKRLEEDLCWTVPQDAPRTQSVKRLNSPELQSYVINDPILY